MSNRYYKSTILKTQQDKPYLKGKQYPNIPLSENDTYIITTIGDRLDYLAYTYYRDSVLWWIISIANNNATKGSLFPIPGTQLRIPANAATVINLFNQFNQSR
jgi:hypothetical protein